MAENNVILRFDEVTFEYQEKRPLLDDASFSVREGAKLTLMGQNGAGKSTLFSLIKGELKPKLGKIHIEEGLTIATAEQVVEREHFDLTIEEYFARAYGDNVPGNIRSEISKVLDAVNFEVPFEKKIGDLSGGQKARILLAYALIQDPDILLLDEPTNNLDEEGINHLVSFLIMYQHTVIVISHDADFLNCFTEGVLYLNSHNKKVEYYVGDYYSVQEEISQRIDREQKKNAQLRKQIIDRKEKANFFSHKGGKMRKLAHKMREEAAEMENMQVDVRRDDRTIAPFEIPVQEIHGKIVELEEVKVINNHQPEIKTVDKVVRNGVKMLITGPNGIGKSTLLRTLVSKEHPGIRILEGIRVGYYSQDFANLNYDQTVYESLQEATHAEISEQEMRDLAARFLLTGQFMGYKVGALSEGQKGLLSFTRLVLMQPGLLILDEPTNHINFRHIPVIAEAVNRYQGALIMVSHMQEFLDKIKFDDYLDLGEL